MDELYIIPENPEYSEMIRKLQDTDPASASETFNPLVERLVENIAALHRRLAHPIVPPGCILIWSGAADAIPAGWALCDGLNDTPDLRDRFVLGAGGKYSMGENGGEESVKLEEENTPYHTHGLAGATVGINFNSGGSYPFYYDDGGPTRNIYTNPPRNWGQPHNNMPPYYALCYIMKL